MISQIGRREEVSDLKRGTLGVLIGDKHTLKDWELGWLAITLGFPEPKTYEQDVPCADGTIDLTEAMTGGDVKYKNRSLSLEFEVPDRDFGEESKLVLSGDVEPYKYELCSSLEDWLWDPFNFNNGIIRNYKDLEVNGTRTLVIRGRRKKVIPVFECSTAMTVSFEGMDYNLPAGRSKVFDIYLGEGDNELVFTGNGTVSVDYRGGML